MSRSRLYTLAAILLALWLAMLLLGGPASEVDRTLLAQFRFPALVPFARLLTRLGDWPVLLPITLCIAALLFFLISRRAGLAYLLLVAGGRLLVEFEKSLVGRARPDESGRLVEVATLSYPSGHAAYSMIAWLGLALLAARAPRTRGAAAALALGLALLVGLSRLVLAVHWPSDVIGGWSFGAAWTLFLVGLVEGTGAPERH